MRLSCSLVKSSFFSFSSLKSNNVPWQNHQSSPKSSISSVKSAFSLVTCHLFPNQNGPGFGPLAALTGAAWLRVARRRIIMGRQAEVPPWKPMGKAMGKAMGKPRET
jgi:hypothetical protein